MSYFFQFQKFRLVVAILLLSGVLILSGCGDSSANTSTPTQPAAAATTSATTASIQATTAPAAATTTAVTTSTSAGAGTTTGDPAKGKEVFLINCQACHLNGGMQAGVGPNLSTSPHALDPAYVTFNVRNGRGDMPPFSKSEVSDSDLTNIIAYLKSIHK